MKTSLKSAAVGGIAGAVMAAATVALAGTGIGDVFNLGKINTVNATSDLSGNVAAPQLRVTNSNAGGSGVLGRHLATSGDQPGVYGETKATSANATGVFGFVPSSSAAGDSSGVKGLNYGPGRGVTGQSTNANGVGVQGEGGRYGMVARGQVSGLWARGTSFAGVEGHSVNATGVFGVSDSWNGVRGEGKYGVSASGTQDGVWATSSNAAGSGVYAQNTGGGWGVYGRSATGLGVFGDSDSREGVKGHSKTGAGVSGFSDGFDGVYGQTKSLYNAGVSGHGGQYGVWGLGRVGVYGATTSGLWAYEANGNVKQNRAGGGWVKAMAFVDPSYPAGQQVRRCFNSQFVGGEDCGITATSGSPGRWHVDFAFDVSDRFLIATAFASKSFSPQHNGIVANAEPGTYATEAEVYLTYNDNDELTNEPFYVVVL